MIDSIQTDSPALQRAFEELHFAIKQLDGEATSFAETLVPPLEQMVAVANKHKGTESEVSSDGTQVAIAAIGRALEVVGDHPASVHLNAALTSLQSDGDDAELPEWIGPEGVYENGYEAIRIAVRNVATVNPPIAYELAEKTWAWYETLAPACADWLMNEAYWTDRQAKKWLEAPHHEFRGQSPEQHWASGGWYDVLVLLDGE